MTGWIGRVRGGFDPGCIVTKCIDTDSGCSVSLAHPFPVCVALNCDRPEAPFDRTKAHPDFLVIAAPSCNEAWVALIEMKTGRRHITHAVQQLRVGASVAKQLIPLIPVKQIVFRPVLVTNRILGKQTRTILQNKISLNSVREERIRWIECGAHLADVFPE